MLGLQIDEGLAVVQVAGLGDDDVEVAVNAELVAVGGEVQVPERGLGRGVLLHDLFLENAQGGKVVFHGLESAQDGLAILGDGGLVRGFVLVNGGEKAGVENGLAGAGPDGPDTAAPFEQA